MSDHLFRQGFGMFYRSKPVNHLTHIIDQAFKRLACSGLNQCLIVELSGGNERASKAQFSPWINQT